MKFLEWRQLRRITAGACVLFWEDRPRISFRASRARCASCQSRSGPNGCWTWRSGCGRRRSGASPWHYRPVGSCNLPSQVAASERRLRRHNRPHYSLVNSPGLSSHPHSYYPRSRSSRSRRSASKRCGARRRSIRRTDYKRGGSCATSYCRTMNSATRSSPATCSIWRKFA